MGNLPRTALWDVPPGKSPYGKHEPPAVRRRDRSRETPVDSPRRAAFQSCSIIPAGREGGQRTTSTCPDRIRMHRELRHNAGTIEGVVDAAEDSLRRRM